MSIWLSKKLIKFLTDSKPFRRYPLSDFDRILHEAKQPDVLLIEGNSVVSKIIQNLTKSSWSHAALFIGKLHDIEDRHLREKVAANIDFDEDTPMIIEGIMGKGIVISPLETYRGFHIRICRPKGIAHQDSQAVINYCINSVGKLYDNRNIFDLMRFLLPWRLLPRKWGSVLFKKGRHSDRAICTSMIVEAFDSVDFPILPDITVEKNGLKLSRYNSALSWPSHFDYSPYFEVVKYPMLNIGDHPLYKSLPWEEKHDQPETD